MENVSPLSQSEGKCQNLPLGKGTYVLVLPARIRGSLPVGKLGVMQLLPGDYLYVGSAHGPGGLRSRLRRHLREEKKTFWHIDYLRAYLEIREIWLNTGSRQLEHWAAEALSELEGSSIPIPGFGASDCRCPSHLYHFPARPELADFLDIFRAMGKGDIDWSVYQV